MSIVITFWISVGVTLLLVAAESEKTMPLWTVKVWTIVTLLCLALAPFFLGLLLTGVIMKKFGRDQKEEEDSLI